MGHFLGKVPKNNRKWQFFDKIDFSGLKYPPEVLAELKTCSTICGTHVQTILNTRFDQVGRGGVVRSKYGPKLPPFAPYCTVF